MQKPTDYISLLFYCLITIKVPLTFLELRKPNVNISFLFLFLLFFFLSFLFVTHNSKTTWCTQIFYIPNNFSTTRYLPFLVWGRVQATTGKLQPWNGPSLCKIFSTGNFCGYAYVLWVRPHPHYWTHAFQAESRCVLRKNCSCKTSFQVGMDLKKVQKQGMRWKKARKLPDICQKYTADVGQSICILTSHVLFLHFFLVQPYLKWSLAETFSLVSVLFGGFLNQLPNRRWTCLLCWKGTLLAMETNAFYAGNEHFSAGDEHLETCVQTSSTNTQLATYKRLSRWLLLTSNHFRKG